MTQSRTVVPENIGVQTMAVIEIQDLTKYYGPNRGIEGLNLRIEQGEVFGFLGPNGAGKTTTIRLLLGLIKPTQGSFLICGSLVKRYASSFRKHIGYLPGEIGLYTDLSGQEYLHRLASLRGGLRKDRVKHLSDCLGLDLSRTIQKLSHGSRQKLAIVQAFMHEARLLILDEPTNGLDPLAQQVFYELINEEKERGVTVFLSSHVLSEVERSCSRVGIVRDGHLIVTQSVDELKKTQAKRVEVEFEAPVESRTLCLPGVQSLQVQGNKITFTLVDHYQTILKALACSAIKNISIKDASLEEIFIEYYSDTDKGEL
jgi:ABC-2 type transport system ATP-binding protein